MAANFTISDSESETSEEVGEEENQQPAGQDPESKPQTLALPVIKTTGAGRLRLNSESHTSSVARDEDLMARGEDEVCTPTEGDPFRRRSKSAPPALWAAKKYGQKLRRMSDEFDSLLDKGEMKLKKLHHSKTWWSYLFSHQETEGENNHLENHNQRTE